MQWIEVWIQFDENTYISSKIEDTRKSIVKEMSFFFFFFIPEPWCLGRISMTNEGPQRLKTRFSMRWSSAIWGSPKELFMIATQVY